jgi:hypothetical protein
MLTQGRSAASKAWLAQQKKTAWSLVSTKLAAEDTAQICQISTAFSPTTARQSGFHEWKVSVSVNGLRLACCCNPCWLLPPA